MKKVLLIALSFLLVLCFLPACTGTGPSGEEASPAPTEAPSSDPGHAGPTDPPSVPADTSFDPETDAINLYSAENGCLIETEDGFYWSCFGSDYLLYYDYGLEEMIPVCGRPDCEHFADNNVLHQNKSCDAYLRAWRNPALYNGKIYYVDDNGAPNPNVDGAAGSFRLMRMEPDGTEKEFVKNLYTPGYESPQWLIFHRGWIYGMSPETIVDHGEVTGRTSIIAMPIDGDETTFRIIYSVDNNGWGCMRFIGDYCYFWIRYQEGYEYINWDTGDYVDETRSGGVAGRWNSKADKLEILYQDLLPEGEDFYQYAWVEEDGTIYVNGSSGLLKIENGELSVVMAFEDPDLEYHLTNLSDGIAIAHTSPRWDSDDPYQELDYWICRFDGTTVFKGKLPMDWFREYAESTSLPGRVTIPGIGMLAGDETGLWFMFSSVWYTSGNNDPDATFLVRYDFTEDGGVQAKLYGSFIAWLTPELQLH